MTDGIISPEFVGMILIGLQLAFSTICLCFDPKYVIDVETNKAKEH